MRRYCDRPHKSKVSGTTDQSDRSHLKTAMRKKSGTKVSRDHLGIQWMMSPRKNEFLDLLLNDLLV